MKSAAKAALGGSEKIQVDLGGGFCAGSMAALAHGCLWSADGWGESDGRERGESGRGSQVEEEREGERAKEKKERTKERKTRKGNERKKKQAGYAVIRHASKPQTAFCTN